MHLSDIHRFKFIVLYLYSETDSRRDPLSWLDGQAAAGNELGSIQGPRRGHQSIEVMLVVFVTD